MLCQFLFLVTENPLKRQERNSSATIVLVPKKAAHSVTREATVPRVFITVFRTRVIPLIAYKKAKLGYMMGGIEIDAIIQHCSDFSSCPKVPVIALVLTIVDASLKRLKSVIPLTHSCRSVLFGYTSTIESLDDIIVIIARIKMSKL